MVLDIQMTFQKIILGKESCPHVDLMNLFNVYKAAKDRVILIGHVF